MHTSLVHAIKSSNKQSLPMMTIALAISMEMPCKAKRHSIISIDILVASLVASVCGCDLDQSKYTRWS